MESAVDVGQGPKRSESAGRSPLAHLKGTRELWYVAVPLVAIVAFAWMLQSGASRGKDFPRQPSEFLSNAEIDRRLERVDARLKDVPDDIRALTEAGILHFQKGQDDYPDAINELHEAARLGATDPRIFYYLGVMYQAEGLYAMAGEAYLKFLRNHPEDLETRMMVAKLEFQNGQFEDAAASYQRLYEARPKDEIVGENLGLSLWKAGKKDEAKKLFTALAAKNGPAGHRSQFYLGQMAFDEKDYKTAVRHFVTVIPSDGNPDLGLPLETVHATVAANFEKLKLWREAKAHWEKVLQQNPQSSQAKTALKTANAAIEKMERAAKAQAAKIAAAKKREEQRQKKK